MSYLYILMKYFYNELLKKSTDYNDLESSIIKNLNDTVESKSEEIFKDIIDGKQSYYDVLSKYFAGELNDIDLFCDCLSNVSYEKTPEIHSEYGNKEALDKYQNDKKEELRNEVYQIVKIDEVNKLFIWIIRNYYMPEFMNDSKKLFNINEFLEDIQYFSFDRVYYNFNEGYDDVLSACIKSEILRQDLISDFVDSGKTRKLIIEQQYAYINELEKLLEIIDKVGNITNLNDEVFKVFLKFIFYFKEMAYQKIIILEKINNKVYTKRVK